MSVQKTMLPASGWILSAREIKLVTPAMISESRQTVTSTTSATIIFRVLKFSAAFTILTVCDFSSFVIGHLLAARSFSEGGSRPIPVLLPLHCPGEDRG